ncbi:MAG: CBS domain-containing protein [Spirochaetota bacterium]
MSGPAIPINAEDSPSYVVELIYRLRVRDVMTTPVQTAGRKSPLRDLQKTMKEKSITGVPIAEGKRLFGIISMDDIIRAMEAGYMDDTAEEHMSRNLIVLEDDMPLSFAISYLEKYRFGRFPVLNRDKELVGILTSRDVITALLVEINKQVERLEEQTKTEKDGAAPGDIHLEFTTWKFDFENAGKPSAEIKRILKERGCDTKTIRRIAVATYELEMNQVVHSEGGRIIFSLEGEIARVTAKDTGPGIPDVEEAMVEGFSTANDWVRSLGFGAGMGLPNARRVSDEFSIESSPEGTVVRIAVYLHCRDKKDTGEQT